MTYVVATWANLFHTHFMSTKRPVSITLPSELRENVEAFARAGSRSRSNTIQFLLTEVLRWSNEAGSDLSVILKSGFSASAESETTNFSVTLSPELVGRIDGIANSIERNRSQTIELMLTEFFRSLSEAPGYREIYERMMAIFPSDLAQWITRLQADGRSTRAKWTGPKQNDG